MLNMSFGHALYGSTYHIDHQSSRTKQFTTFEGTVYDPDIQGIANLFTFHMNRESAAHVAAAYAHVNRVLKRACGESFTPHGFVADEAGALLAGTRQMHPSAQIATYDYHYKVNCLQVVSKEIGTRNDIITFLRFTQALQRASSPFVYESVMKHFYVWIDLLESRQRRLRSFVDWWDSRRDHWATAFKPNDVDKHSLAESNNSKIARKTIMKNSSIDNCLIFELMHLMRHTIRTGELLKRERTREVVVHKKSPCEARS